jgi:N-acetylglutamate synthase-like GNAT family acetyltransferase
MVQVSRGIVELGFRRIYLFTFDKADFYRALGWSEIQQAR